jgi:hypothetical protein
MNIFALDTDPMRSAHMHCDKHICKMSIEYAQILSTVHRRHGADDAQLYRATHVHHPATLWAGAHPMHYQWLYALTDATWQEYTFRYRKPHSTATKLRARLAQPPATLYADTEATPPPQCMPVNVQLDGGTWDATVQAYRRYYVVHKHDIAVWARGRSAPLWWNAAHRDGA